MFIEIILFTPPSRIRFWTFRFERPSPYKLGGGRCLDSPSPSTSGPPQKSVLTLYENQWGDLEMSFESLCMRITTRVEPGMTRPINITAVALFWRENGNFPPFLLSSPTIKARVLSSATQYLLPKQNPPFLVGKINVLIVLLLSNPSVRVYFLLYSRDFCFDLFRLTELEGTWLAMEAEIKAEFEKSNFVLGEEEEILQKCLFPLLRVLFSQWFFFLCFVFES